MKNLLPQLLTFLVFVLTSLWKFGRKYGWGYFGYLLLILLTCLATTTYVIGNCSYPKAMGMGGLSLLFIIPLYYLVTIGLVMGMAGYCCTFENKAVIGPITKVHLYLSACIVITLILGFLFLISILGLTTFS